MTRTEAIILSMTPKERDNPSMHQRTAGSSGIAAGCGSDRPRMSIRLLEPI